MRNAEAIKKEVKKLLEEIGTIKKESDEILSDESFEQLRTEMKNELEVINLGILPIIEKLNKLKKALKQFEEDKVKRAQKKAHVQELIEQNESLIGQLSKQLKNAQNPTTKQEAEKIEAQIQNGEAQKISLKNQAATMEKDNELTLKNISETSKAIVEHKKLLRKLKKDRSIEIYSKYRKTIHADRLEANAKYFKVSKAQVFNTEFQQYKQLVVQSVLTDIKDNEELVQSQGTLTDAQFEAACKAGIIYIMSNLEKNNASKVEDNKKKLREAGWKFGLMGGDPEIKGCNNLYLKLQELAYEKYITYQKTMNEISGDKPIFVLSDLILNEISELTNAVGIDLQQQAQASASEASNVKRERPKGIKMASSEAAAKEKLQNLEAELIPLKQQSLTLQQTIRSATDEVTQPNGDSKETSEKTEKTMRIVIQQLAENEDLTKKISTTESEIKKLKFAEFKKKVVQDAVDYIATHHGPWAEGSAQKLDEKTGKGTSQESAKDLASDRWIPMLTYILNQLTAANALELAKSKKICEGSWNFENLACPKRMVIEFPDDLYSSLQQLVYEIYKKRIKLFFDLTHSDLEGEELKIEADTPVVEKERSDSVVDSSVLKRGSDINPALLNRYSALTEGDTTPEFKNVLDSSVQSLHATSGDNAGKTLLHAASTSAADIQFANLLKAIAENDVVKFTTILNSSVEDFNVNARDEQGKTLLQAASAFDKDIQFANLLLERGANPCLQDHETHTSIYEATSNRRADILELYTRIDTSNIPGITAREIEESWKNAEKILNSIESAVKLINQDSENASLQFKDYKAERNIINAHLQKLRNSSKPA